MCLFAWGFCLFSKDHVSDNIHFQSQHKLRHHFSITQLCLSTWTGLYRSVENITPFPAYALPAPPPHTYSEVVTRDNQNYRYKWHPFYCQFLMLTHPSCLSKAPWKQNPRFTGSRATVQSNLVSGIWYQRPWAWSLYIIPFVHQNSPVR